MHHEAALYMAQALGVPVPDTAWQGQRAARAANDVAAAGRPLAAGQRRPTAGFAFDNELPRPRPAVGATAIDAQAVRWAEYLPFVQDGGYADRGGGARRVPPGAAQPTAAPRYLRQDGGTGSNGGTGGGAIWTRASPPAT
jgi:iron(II)-dependent oxidoreductase